MPDRPNRKYLIAETVENIMATYLQVDGDGLRIENEDNLRQALTTIIEAQVTSAEIGGEEGALIMFMMLTDSDDVVRIIDRDLLVKRLRQLLATQKRMAQFRQPKQA